MNVLFCGNMNHDIILSLPRFPKFHEKLSADTYYEGEGGSAANTCWWYAGLGGSARMCAAVGSDDRGDACVRSLRRHGVDTSHVVRVDDPTGLAVVISCGQDKRMVKVRGANDRVHCTQGTLTGIDHMHLSSVAHDVGTEAIRHARAVGATISWDPSEQLHEDLLSQVDILFINEDDYERMGQKGTFPPTVVVTKNKGGCTINGSIEVPTYGTTTIDTTGAGDAFDAGYLHALHMGADPWECGVWGVVCSSFNVARVGARDGFTSREDIEQTAQRVIRDLRASSR
jgi:ribokinase